MKIGLIVNPVAGLGGPLALKGSDGALAELAIARGAKAKAPERASRALQALAPLASRLRLAGGGGAMGADEAKAAGLAIEVLHRPQERTSREDTLATVRQILAWRPQLILFAGGDGTARDIMEAAGQGCPVLGIPSGVKMHSAVFARTPREAGALAAALAAMPPEARSFTLAEVVDRDEDGVPRLFGTMLVPTDPRRMQPAKASPAADDRGETDAACRRLAEALGGEDRVAIVGPGSSTLRLKHLLGDGGTLLGVDLYEAGRLIVEDAGEAEILAAIRDRPARLVLGVIGGQGFLIGRGNQQISPEVLRAVGRDNILALASASKLAALPDRTLHADTGDEALDAELAGFVPVQVSATRRVIMPLNSHLRRARGATFEGQ